MKTLNGKWYECTVQFTKDVDGVNKKVAEKVICNSYDFATAEKTVVDDYQGMSYDDAEMTAMVIAQYSIVLKKEEDADIKSFHKVKYALIVIDERTGKEKKSTGYMLIESESNDEALKSFHDYMRTSMLDYKVVSVSETGIIDIYE